MKILLFGRTGTLGKQFYSLYRSKHEIISVTRMETGDPNNIVLDLNVPDFTSELPSDVDTIIYSAQSRKYKDFPGGANDVLHVNVTAPLHLAKWGAQNNIKRFIYLSSGGVYKNDNKPVKEAENINANEDMGFYLSSKLSAEVLLKPFAQKYSTFNILRPFFIFDENQKDMLLPNLFESVYREKEIYLSSEKGLEINPIYSKDAAMLVEKSIYLDGFNLINICGDQVISLKEICDIFGKQLNKDIYYKQKDGPRVLVGDHYKMSELLGLPQYDLLQSLKKFKR